MLVQTSEHAVLLYFVYNYFMTDRVRKVYNKFLDKPSRLLHIRHDR